MLYRFDYSLMKVERETAPFAKFTSSIYIPALIAGTLIVFSTTATFATILPSIDTMEAVVAFSLAVSRRIIFLTILRVFLTL